MMARRSLMRVATIVCVAALLSAAAACEGDVTGNGADGAIDAAADAAGDAPADGPGADRPLSSEAGKFVVVEPAGQQLVVELGKSVPTVQYVAKLGGQEVPAKWRLDRGELGTITSAGLFTPAGNLGGVGQITAVVGSLEGSTTVKITLKMEQNGLTTQNGNPGPGGFGGVGGEGLGPAVTPAVKTVLDGATTADPSLKLLYPYDKTVWPLGILAPLLQWNKIPQGLGDGVLIELTGSEFSYKGYFGRPAALDVAALLLRHPLPQNVWKAATHSAAGGTLTLKVVIAADGKAYGALSQTWTIARGALRGTVYYQSYGTNLAKNYGGAIGGDGMFGGATLAIKGGSSDPILVAGQNGGSSQCRVCHSVAADGSRMVVQHGDNYKASSSYDLLSGYAETAYAPSTNGQLGWIGMTPDGKLGLGNAVPIPGGANTGNTALYDMTTGAALLAPGLSAFVSQAGFPMFSPDGKRVAFNFHAGSGDATIGAGDGTQLVLMDFDATTQTFSGAKLMHKGSATHRPGWPAFWPTNNALVFQVEQPGNTSGEYFATRYGARGELWWVDLATGKGSPLHALNGKTAAGVLTIPTGPNSHQDDSTLNYEPTVSPIASGGYAWVVLVSRRLYGNVATIDPWWSDPREHDLTQTPTTKKLWVAALDLNPTPGTDPSHPAFYLPAQELLAGNSRGFWVADPCKADGKTCEGGDECCGGYCTQQSGTGPLTCGQIVVGCSKEFDKCQLDADCCDYPKFQCVNGHCARWKIN